MSKHNNFTIIFYFIFGSRVPIYNMMFVHDYIECISKLYFIIYKKLKYRGVDYTVKYRRRDYSMSLYSVILPL